MNVLRTVLQRVEGFFEAQAVRYRNAYLAQIKHLPEPERQIGHRGVFLP